MGSRTIADREECRHSAHVDRHPTRGVACVHSISPDRRDEVVGTGQVLSAASGQATQVETQVRPEEIEPHQVWFALPSEQRSRFGGHFSELLLRAVQHRNDLISVEGIQA